MATQAEIDAGAAALRAYVESISPIAVYFVPAAAYERGATDVIDAADASADQSAAARQHAGETALRAALDATGEGGEISDAQCIAAVTAVLGAIAALRRRQQANT